MSDTRLPELPSGWRYRPLRELVEFTKRPRGLTPIDDVPFLPMALISATDPDIHDYEMRPPARAKSGTYFEEGDLLVARITPCFENGKQGLVRDVPGGWGMATTEVYAMRSTELDHEYLSLYLRSRAVHDALIGRMEGATGRMRLPKESLEDLPIAAPSLPQQREVVEALRGHLERVGEGLSHFRRAAAQVHEFRRALLDEALAQCAAPAADGASTHDGKPALPSLPSGWSWSTVGAEGFVQLGRMLSQDRHTGEHTHPYLRVANVLDNQLDLTDVKEMDFPPGEYERYLLHPGDILLNEGQSPELLGRAAMYRGERPGLCFQKTLLRWQAGDRVDAEFALLVFRHYLYSGRFRRESRITTGIGHLTGVRFSAIEFPVPPLAEQKRIVATARRQLDAVDDVERTFLSGEQQADELRASLMVEAFAGRLHRGPMHEANEEPSASGHQKDRHAVLVAE